MTNKNKKAHYFSIMSNAPWYLSVGIALATYGFCLHGKDYIKTDNFIFTAILNALPNIAILSFILAIPAPIAFWRRRQRNKRLEKQHSIYSLQKLSWSEFEELVADAYRRQGYTVIENDQGGADGGTDLKLIKNGELTLVQCKNWRSNRVGVQIAREMFGVMIAEKAKRMLIITSGEFTKEALDFAKDKPLSLIDGSQLIELIEVVQTSNKDKRPICPKCHGHLVERIARKGAKKNTRFLGCENFPKCNYTQD
ncbi:DUF2034 domain-containing protein [Vibrio cholerae]|nr:DUF2034 domain-containing protein [Vibrio cholerae]EGR0600818.1 DUF2034 domain-containing protein [Vibrio cholerae]